LINDPDWVVRYIVAQRAPLEILSRLLHDPEADIIELVTKRLHSVQRTQLS